MHIALAIVVVAIAGTVAWYVAHPGPVLAEEILGKPGTLRIIGTTYPTDSVIVAKYVATQDPYDANATGASDATAAFQNAMDDAVITSPSTISARASSSRTRTSATR